MKVKSIRFFLLVLTFTFSATLSQAQSDQKKADAYFKNYDFYLALDHYLKALEKQEPDLDLTQKIAHCYRLINNSEKAEFWYAQVLNYPAAAAINELYYAEALKKNGDYPKAKKYFLSYAAKVPSEKELALKQALSCDVAMDWIATPKKLAIKPEQPLNTKGADFSPVFYKDGLLISSDRSASQSQGKDVFGWTGAPYLKLFYIAQVSDSAWAAPVPLDETINTTYHNAVATLSPNQDVIYFTRTNKVKKTNKNVNTDPTSWVATPASSDFINRLEIYQSVNKGGKWAKATPFKYNNSATFSVGHPALSPDGNILYFVSDMPGGVGETDIYYCEKESDGSWGKPVNLGSTINTPGKEVFPTLDSAGTLYFSSDTHIGMGGLDLFSATGSKAQWSAVENLRFPINSPKDDFGVIFHQNGKDGYLSSNRESAEGADDIFRFKPIKILCPVAGKTIERVAQKNNKFKEVPVENVQLRIYREQDTVAMVTHSDAEGNFTFKLEESTTYTIKASKKGYLTQSATITPDCKSVIDMIRMTLNLNRNVLNKPIVVENIYYDLDKYDIRPDAAAELDKLVTMLKDNPTIKIELSSHTDSRQTDFYNMMLSQLRAESAVKYIVEHGIDPKRITAKGYGETRLLNRCKNGVTCSEDEHQLNRRTEFKLIR